MRNIALLEWGPASLFHIQPRERIMVRSGWLEGGPIMPSFLSTKDESKANSSDICVRYALSAFEDLNSAIKNLRRCFGFPYQEYIGYLNTLSRTHRARREHEALVDRLRKWAIFGNVDAVVWIDYAKANQPPGSFKMGPRDSRPFSKDHMELCTHLPDDAGRENNNDGDSEAAWSDVEEEAGGGAVASAPHHSQQQQQQQQNEISLSQGSHRTSLVLQRGHSAGAECRGVKLKRLVRASELFEQKAGSLSARTSKSARDGVEGGRSPASRLQENAMLSTMIQDEVVPGHGSIYLRTIAPGPGYYGVPGGSTLEDGGTGVFGHKPDGRIDKIMKLQADAPGPTAYTPSAEIIELRPKNGKFGQAVRSVPPTEAARKLPFISKEASRSEGYGIDSPGLHHCAGPREPCHGVAKAPKYSFSRMKRPF